MDAPDSDGDPARTATLPARPGSTPTAIPERTAPSERTGDLESAAQDLAELPVVDPDTYVFGRYFARGGMGRIAEVRDKRLGRVIAIKELIARDPGLVARFHREIQITARLQHPSIVSLLEAGRWPSGEPFFAMKKVSGQSLKEAIERRKTLDERLGLLASTIAIVDALAYAHDRGIIHRDLKPANVLVGEFGETVVIDWGLAKDLRAADDAPDPLPSLARGADSQMTAAGSILGTPSFMAPEQARGEDADERTDVYALGAILYTVLTGAPPFVGGDAASIMARVLEEAPRPVGELEPRIPVDLQTIVARAMARDRDERYPSAKELATDLARFQTGQLVAAHRYTRRQLFTRWLRRHRGAVLVGAVAAVVLAALGTASVIGIVRERDRARAAEQVASARADALVLAQARATVESDPLKAITVLSELSLGSVHWPAARMVASDAVARGLPTVVWEARSVDELELSPDGKLAAYARDAELRLRELASGTERVLGSHDAEISDVVFSRDGTRIATASRDNTVAIWSLDGSPPRRLRGHRGYVLGVELSGDDTHAISSSLDRVTRVWSLATGEARELPALLFARELSPDAKLLIATEPQEGRALWDLATGKRVLELGQRCAAFLPGTSTLLIAGDGKVLTRDLASGAETVLRELSDRCTALAIGRDGTIVIGTSVGAMLVRDPAKQSWAYRGLTRPITGLQVRADGALVAAWSSEGAVHLLDTRTKSGQALAGSRGEARFADDDRVIAFGVERELLAWTTTRGGARVFQAGELARRAGLSPDGTTLASGGPGWTLRITDLATRQTRDLRGHQATVQHAVFSPNGALIAALDDDHRVRLWEPRAGRSVLLPGRGQRGLRFSPDGELLAAIGDQRDISVWSVRTGAVRSFVGHTGIPLALAFSPGGVLATAGADHTVRVWSTADGTSKILGTHHAPIRALVFSPDGSWLAATDERASVRLWPVAGGPPRVLAAHEGWVLAAAFDPSGRTLATAGTDKQVRLWDVATGAPRVIGRHAETVLDLAFSPDGRTLASACLDGTARLWDVGAGESRELAGHAAWVWQVQWFADGTRLATSSRDGTVRVWSDELPRDPAALRAWLAAAAR
ncbi:MAG: protein kinase [Myxococcales bacterium]|nr:protein kinase [Myxococcales bacterium]